MPFIVGHRAGLFLGCAAALLLTAARPAAAANCASLTGLSLPGVTITSATAVTPPFNPPGLPTVTISVPFCRVVGVDSPVAGSLINFEVWLPAAQSWNRRFRGEGSGGSAGSIAYSAMVDGLNRNYATMAQDNGHTGSSWTFSENPQAVIDFGYRAEHVTTVAAKRIVKAYYGEPAQHAYFVGCSQGGHHAEMEAQRYPDDYDGIVAGDPGYDWTHLLYSEAWVGLSSTAGGTDLPQTQLNLVTQAVLAQCAGQDGGLKTDPFLNDPRDCHFDPSVLQCDAGQDPSTCLTAAQVVAVKKIYRGPRDTINGAQIFPGLERGSENAWRQYLVGTTVPGVSSDSFFVNAVFDDPNYNFQNFNFGTDVALTDNKMFAGQTLEQILDALNPDLEPFRLSGGKMIIYQGWADPLSGPLAAIDLYTQVVAYQARFRGLNWVWDQLNARNQRIDWNGPDRTALQQTRQFARLFMVPGMYHCAGGPGANAFGGAGQPANTPLDRQDDVVDALDAWVSDGVAPERITATKYVNDTPADGVAFTRPICAYPQMPVYKGSGDQTKAENFACVTDEPDNNGPPLLGLGAAGSR